MSETVANYFRPNSAVFERYQPMINDWAAFQEALFYPLPTCIWINTLRTTPKHVAGLLTEEGIPFEPLAWYPGGFKLPPTFKPGRHWAFLAGLYHVQEEVSMLPLTFLDPQAGERILDLCAAPGNKTAQIAMSMANRGTVVANDINFGRMRAARQTLERLGLANVTTTIYDGANYPKTAGSFDKILVDVPCTCEGTSRKDPGVIRRISPQLSRKKSRSQQAMLKKAVELCKPGGRVVYATCTYAPEENEMVVDAVLREYGPDLLRIVPAHVEGLSSSPGVTQWQGQPLHPALRHTMRIWPHQNDTGGFFIAAIHKIGSAAATDGARPNEEDELESSLGKLRPVESLPALVAQRFGLTPEHFEPYLLFRRGKKRFYLVAPDHQPSIQPPPDASGLLFTRVRRRYPKLSTAIAMMLGSKARQNYLDVDPEQAQAYLSRQSFLASAAQCHLCTDIGYVLVRFKGFTLGVAFYRPDETGQGGRVHSMFPKGWSPAGLAGPNPT